MVNFEVSEVGESLFWKKSLIVSVRFWRWCVGSDLRVNMRQEANELSRLFVVLVKIVALA